MNDLYSVLGVPRDATPEQIKAAYRKLASQFHPDKNTGEEDTTARFQVIQQAYEVLSDPERRRIYDAGGIPDQRSLTEEEQIDAQARGGLVQLIDQMFDQWDENALRHHNFAESVMVNLANISKNARQQRRATWHQLRKNRQLRRRLKADRFMAAHLHQKRVELMKRWRLQRLNVRVLRRMTEIAGEMRYETDQLEQSEPRWVTMYSG